MKTARYLILRLIWMIITLLLIIVLVFFSTRLVMLTTWQRLAFLDALPIVKDEFTAYIRLILTEWNWGETGYFRPESQTILQIFKRKAPITLKINAAALVTYVTFGIIIGIISALNSHNFIDKILGIIIMLLSALPNFIIIWPLMIIFGYQLGWLPRFYQVGSMYTPLNLVIPIVALSGMSIATIARFVRGELIESLQSDYVLLAKTKGLTKTQATVKHALRNSIAPVLPEIPSTFFVVITGSFFVEVVYNVPGLATWFVKSMIPGYGATQPPFVIDTPVVVIITIFYALLYQIAIFIIDIMYVIIDPRIKMGSKK